MSFNQSAEVLREIRSGRGNISLSDDSFNAPRRIVMGEYVLVEAVLGQAIREYQKFAGDQTRRGTRLFREIDQWFAEDDRKWDFSFLNICQILDLEPAYIRTGLKMWCNCNVRKNADLCRAKSGTPASTRGHAEVFTAEPLLSR